MARCLDGWPGMIAAYGFGSQAKGESPSPRDVDIAVLAGSRLSLDELLDLRRQLSSVLGTDRLDVVDLRSAGPVLKKNVIACDMRFYCRDDHAANEFELRVLSEYRDSAYRRGLQIKVLREELALS